MNKCEKWPKSLVKWREKDTTYMSVVFTWHLPDAHTLCDWERQAGRRVVAGGPAVSLMPDYLKDVAEIGGDIPALARHNPNATFTTRGCIRTCSFCAVPKIEGKFRELTEWAPAPVICDNNLLASSQKHFDNVIDRLKPFKGVDFNQGLDARLFNDHHLDRLRELNLPTIRFSWDYVAEEPQVLTALTKCLDASISKGRLSCYVLIGHGDTPEDALYRLETLRKRGVRMNPMRYQPLNALTKDSHVEAPWTEQELHRMMRYWSRQNWFSKVPYAEWVE